MTENFKIAFFSLIISFTTILPISSFAAKKLIKNDKEIIEKKEHKKDFEYIIPKKQDISTLVSITDEFPNPGKIYLLIKISAHDKLIEVLLIPKNYKSTVNKNYATIEKLHKIGGIDYAKQGIEKITNKEIDRVLELDSNAIYGICDSLGGVKIPVYKNFKDKNKKYKTIEGEEYYKEIIKSPIKSIMALKNCFDSKTNLSNLYATIANLGKTDITIYDFESRKKGFEKLMTQEGTRTETKEI